MYTNARSMGNKQEELEAMVQQKSYDIAAIMEMWWDGLHNWSTALDGYKLFRRDRRGRRGGGMVLYIREVLNTMEIETDYDDKVECLWVRIWGKANKADILVGVCYRPPNQEEEVDNVFHKQLQDVSRSPAVVLVGDFKLPDICWELNTAEKRQSRRFSVYGGQLPVTADEGWNLVTKDEEKAEVLNTFFASVFNRKTDCPQEKCPPGLVDGVREQNSSPVCQEEAFRDLSHLDSHKSMRPDGIHPRVMRGLADELVELLSIIYHQSWLTGEVPDDWKLANVMPIHIKGRNEDPGNYRPASLTSVPSKIMEQIECHHTAATGWPRNQTQLA
ncbi:hypothetical protein HGM15179_018789 [Zosterops borbonicus]|uniref:Endonuclease/exonuclease/phosphatase domain-containing protein n=1 Tax=Zosterops borbonicus TaxID=364589 RepID=A0A8K1FYS8_9PASS|nr:hypothetical protein HGM15179_018789 [Zosterops borbonicus]